MALDTIRTHCRQLRLPTVAAVEGRTLETAQREEWALETFLTHLLEQELDGRRTRRITRLLKAAHLPPGKTLETSHNSRKVNSSPAATTCCSSVCRARGKPI